MIGRLRETVARHWPPLRLRAILFAVLLFTAAMPGIGAISLRVYENTLVRQTEAELVAQGAALTAAAAAAWPGAPPHLPPPDDPPAEYYRDEPTTIDLSRTPVLRERPVARPAAGPVDPNAVAVAAGLQPIIDETVRVTLASALLLDGRGRVASGAERGGDLSFLPEVQGALAGKSRSVFRQNGDLTPRYRFEWLSRASGIRLHHARPIVVGDRVVGVVLLSRSPRALFRGLYEDRGKIAIGIVVIFGILTVLAGIVSRGVTRPIERLSRASRDLAAGHPAQAPETPATAAVEIRALYDDFRAMAERIERRSGYLKDFAAAVSHEFKTPLAGITGAVELLEDHFETMSAEERRRFLANIAADSERLSQLVTRLLDLARADMALPEAGVSTDLAAVVARVSRQHSDEGFWVAGEPPAGIAPVAVPEATLETALAILFQNSRQAGASHAMLGWREAEGRVTLSVADDGPGVPEADRDRLFEPFFTSRRAEGGTGLGLPIARSLLAASGAGLAFAPTGEGARFELSLPVA